MTTLEGKDSRSTLVEQTERLRMHDDTPLPMTPGSPFSASFDPNNPTPTTPGFVAPAAVVRRPALAGRRASDVWSTTVSSSLGTLAAQFAAASQALAALPATAEGDDDTDSAASTGSVAAVQQAQARLDQELEALREQVANLGDLRRRAEKEKEREGFMGIDDGWRENIETRFLGIEKKVDELAETIRLECVGFLIQFLRGGC